MGAGDVGSFFFPLGSCRSGRVSMGGFRVACGVGRTIADDEIQLSSRNNEVTRWWYH